MSTKLCGWNSTLNSFYHRLDEIYFTNWPIAAQYSKYYHYAFAMSLSPLKVQKTAIRFIIVLIRGNAWDYEKKRLNVVNFFNK